MSKAKTKSKSGHRPPGRGKPPSAGDALASGRGTGGRAAVWGFLLVAAPGLALLVPLFNLRPAQVHLIVGSWCVLTGLLCLAGAWRGRGHRRLLAIHGAAVLLAGTVLLLLLIPPSP